MGLETRDGAISHDSEKQAKLESERFLAGLINSRFDKKERFAELRWNSPAKIIGKSWS
jgi:hypothetical protein